MDGNFVDIVCDVFSLDDKTKGYDSQRPLIMGTNCRVEVRQKVPTKPGSLDFGNSLLLETIRPKMVQVRATNRFYVPIDFNLKR